MDIKDMKQGARYRVTFEGECTSNGTETYSTPIRPDGSDCSHWLRTEAKYKIEEISPAEPSYDQVIKITSGHTANVWVYTWGYSDHKWRNGSTTDSWEGLLDMCRRNGHTYTVCKLVEV
jgi:hypothetical protein